jgi:hypothetical protein
LADALHDFMLGEGSNKQLFKAMTDAELRARYGLQEAEAATSVGATRTQTERPSIVHTSLYLPEPVYEALRKIAFEERLKIHDVVLEGMIWHCGGVGMRGHAVGATWTPRSRGPLAN